MGWLGSEDGGGASFVGGESGAGADSCITRLYHGECLPGNCLQGIYLSKRGATTGSHAA
jgi:hypothetical protein